MNSLRKSKNTGFRSYIVELEDYHERAVDVPLESSLENISPVMLPGEVIVSEMKNVLKFTSFKSKNVVILGSLFVTNFKLSFITTSLPISSKESCLHGFCLHSDFLSLNDVSLTQIETIYCLTEIEASKKKKITPNTPLPTKIKGLQIILKNFRVLNFGFSFTQSKEGLKLLKSLTVHRYPLKLDLFYLALNSPPPFCGIPNYNSCTDWENELRRTKCPNWRVTKHNEEYKNFPSLPLNFVVPNGITDNEFGNSAPHFRGYRPIVWCWGTPRGAAVVRMAQLSPGISSNSSIENYIIKLVHKCHPQKIPPTIFDLDAKLPSLKSLQSSYVKLSEMHTFDTPYDSSESEKGYLSRWQMSGWLSHVQACLDLAQNAAFCAAIKNSSVVLQELDGRDMNCVISSLIQILLDPFYRSIRGFHSLIQKEWVALGHPFSVRLGHLNSSSEDMSPVWLLFLDCVRQIAVSDPSFFEFSPEYLVALFQASHCSLHSTFMFDSLKERFYTLETLREESRKNHVYFWPVWSWWGCSDGLRNILNRNSLQSMRAELKQRKNNLEKRKSLLIGTNSNSNSTNSTNNVLPNITPKSAPDLTNFVNLTIGKTGRYKESNFDSIGFEGREILTKENELNGEEGSSKRESDLRRKARRRFLNPFFIQKLLNVLSKPESLTRISDPLSSVNNLWRRICFLMGKSSSVSSYSLNFCLPYDPNLCLPPLSIPRNVPINTSFRVTPWIGAFSYWSVATEQNRTNKGAATRQFLEPFTSYNFDSYWVEIERVFNLFEEFIFLDNSVKRNQLCVNGL